MKIIELKNVNKIYRNNGLFQKETNAHILKSISLFIEEGKTLGLVGESGSGKTTTTRMVLGQEQPTSGDILYYGKNIWDFNKKEKLDYKRNVQVVFQDPYSSLNPEMKIWDIIAEPLKISGNHKKSEIDQKVKKMMSRVGLAEDYLWRYPKEFSGGQRQRIAIARALIQSPKLLILDEPVSALDVSIRGQILNLLKGLQASDNISYLFISHDMSSVGFLSDTIAVMYFGYIVEYSTTENILSDYKHPYTAMLLEANSAVNLDDVEQGDMIEAPSHIHPPDGCPYADRCPYASKTCRKAVPEFLEIEPNHFVACHKAKELDLIGKSEKLFKTMPPEYLI